MSYPTYTLRPFGIPSPVYSRVVSEFADEVLRRGERLRTLVSDYGDFVATAWREPRRSHDEYLLEALLLGVLWRSRGHEAIAAAHGRQDVLHRLAGERSSGCGRRRDGSNADLLVLDAAPVSFAPSPEDLDHLLEWLLATGEYDDELARLRGWRVFLAKQPATAANLLPAIVDFAAAFDDISVRALGPFTAQVDGFRRAVLAKRAVREDTVQCSRTRLEYHFNMVGAEVLNRAWRSAFLACSRHVVVLPGCARERTGNECLGDRFETEIRCRRCARTCAVAAATALASDHGGEALAVLHGSDFGRFLRSPALAGGDVGIVGVACVPGLVGAGWRARAQGLPAQCVLLESSGCVHWCDQPVPTSLDLGELARILATAPEREQVEAEASAA